MTRSEVANAQATDALVATRYAGNARIELRRHELGHYSVTTFVGPQRCDAWSNTYADHATAKAEAERTRKLFRQYRTDGAIEAARVELTTAIRDLMNVRRMSRTQRDRFEQLNAAAEDLDDLATRQQRNDLTSLNQAA